MLAYTIRRLILLVPVWFGITTLVFLMRALVPGDPVEIMFFGQLSDRNAIESIRHEMGLDRPLPVQYVDYLGNVLKGDLGKSVVTRRPVAQEIQDRYPTTILLTVTSLTVSIAIGLLTGIISAVFRDSLIDTLSMLVALAGLSMPAFWLGLVMIYVFAVQLGWFPVLGSSSPRHMVLPALTLGIVASSYLARIVRSSMLEVLNQEYIRAARAKGLREQVVVMRHALKNALIPIVTVIGLQFGGLLTGAFIIEVVFSWHGVGELAVQALQRRDFPLIQGIVLVISTTYVLVNLGVDILYKALDPRISFT